MSLIPFSGDESDDARFVSALHGNARLLLQHVSDAAVESALAHVRADQGQAAAAVHALFAQSEANRKAGHDAVMRAGAESEENMLQLLNWAQHNYASKLEEARMEHAAKIRQQEIALKDTALKASAHVESTRVDLEHKLALVETAAKRQVFSVQEHVERKSLDTDKATAEALRAVHERLHAIEAQMTQRLDEERLKALSMTSEVRSVLQGEIIRVDGNLNAHANQVTSAQTKLGAKISHEANARAIAECELREKIEALEAQLTQERSNVSSLLSKLTTGMSELQALRNRCDEASTGMEAKVASLEGQLASLTSKLNAATNETQALRTSLVDQQANTQRAISLARSYADKVRTLETEIADLRSSSTSNTFTTSEGGKRVSELSTTISLVRHDIESLRARIATLEVPDEDEDDSRMRDFNERYEEFNRQLAVKMNELRALTKEKKLSESRERPPQPSATKSPLARDPHKSDDECSSCSSRSGLSTVTGVSSSRPVDNPDRFDSGSTMKAVVQKGWLDTRKKDVYLFEHSVGSAIAKFTAHYNVPFKNEGLASQLHANLIQRVATRFSSEESDRRLTEELLEFVKRERYTSEALTQSILKPEHGRQSLCELLVALGSSDPVGTMNIFRRARMPTTAVDSATFSAEAAGTLALRVRLPVLGECEQRLTACYDRLFQKEKPGGVARGGRGGKKSSTTEEGPSSTKNTK